MNLLVEGREGESERERERQRETEREKDSNVTFWLNFTLPFHTHVIIIKSNDNWALHSLSLVNDKQNFFSTCNSRYVHSISIEFSAVRFVKTELFSNVSGTAAYGTVWKL